MSTELKKRKPVAAGPKTTLTMKKTPGLKQQNASAKNQEPLFKHRQVMLIDDSDLDNFINEKLMEIHHFAEKIYVTTGATSAIEFFNNLVAMEDKWPELCPEVIFIDINMPTLDGFQFIELFKKTFGKIQPQPKLVVLTSSLDPKDNQKTKDLSEDILFLNKPLTRELLDEI